MKYENIPQKFHYGHEAPVKPLFSRIIAAIKVQMADKENREEAAATLLVIGILILTLVGFWLLLPGAIGHEIDHSRSVVAESLK